jgi:hypothetical protein
MNDFQDLIRHSLKSRLIILGLIIYILFNVSSFKTHWFDYFFFGSSLHYCCKGLDFYGIPNGVHSFINGGDLNGNNPNEEKYSENIPSNPNDYHPLTALIVGGFLILFDHERSFYIWMAIKIPITLFAAYYIYKNFKENRNLNLAIFIFLANFSSYNEIRISQYQFLFNISLLFFLIHLVKGGNKLEASVLYFFTLIAKPISLLIAPVLILKNKSYVALIGLILFGISTLTFNVIGVGNYFTDNLLHHLLNPKYSEAIDFMSLEAFLRTFLGITPEMIKVLKYLMLGFIYLILLNKRISILTGIFFIICYFLFFYDHIFQYHFSIMGPLLAICLLAVKSFQGKITKYLIIIINLPNVFFLLRTFNFQFLNDLTYGPNPTTLGWQMTSFFQLMPIIILFIIVLLKELGIRNIYEKTK